MAEERLELSSIEISRRKLWYNRIFILMEMIEFSKNRETCFLNGLNRIDNVRNLNCGSVEFLMKQMGIQTNTEKAENRPPSDPWHFFNPKKNYNIYFSLAKMDWSLVPVKALSYAHVKRKEQQVHLKENISKYITDFYGGLDLDGDLDGYDEYGNGIKLDIPREDAVNRALEELKQVKKIFDDYKLKYFIQYSGSRGFHLIFEIPLNISVNQKCDLANEIVDCLRVILDLKTIDRARLHLRKIFKLPYSVCTKDISRIVLPLNPEQIDNFSLDIVDLSYVLNNQKMRIKGRGVIWRNDNLNKEESIINYMKFLDDFEINIPENKEYKDGS